MAARIIGQPQPKAGERMSIEDFARAFIVKAKASNPGFDGVHSVYAKVGGYNFNQVYSAYWSAGRLEEGAPESPIDATTRLSAANKLVVRLVSGGAYLILPENARQSKEKTPSTRPSPLDALRENP